MDPWVLSVQNWINSTYAGVPDIAPIAADGRTGWQTMYALTRALQYELGITNRSNTFGPGTTAAVNAIAPIGASTTNGNIISIVQGAMYCSGYDAGTGGKLTGVWGSAVQSALNDLRSDIGLASSSTGLNAKLFRALLTMDAYKLISGGDAEVRTVQQALNGRYAHRRDFVIIPADGHRSRNLQKAMLFAIQYEIGMADGVANGNFGPGTKTGLRTQALLSSGDTDSSKYFVHLFQAALIVSGYSVPFSGTFNQTTVAQTRSFQDFAALAATGSANLYTWASLLVSTGDPDRPGTGVDCVMTLTDERMGVLREAGYTHFGRYIFNTPNSHPGKSLKRGELETILEHNGRFFPIFQTGGADPAHFTYDRGRDVAEEATNAAWAYRIPQGAVIYFAVDFDAVDADVTNLIIPYFEGIKSAWGITGQNYRVGIYGPRNVCSRVSAAGLAESSFVSDMSTGFSGNIGYPLPENWAFDQIQTLSLGEPGTPYRIEIDKNIVSGRDAGVAQLAAANGVGNDPRIPQGSRIAFEEDYYQACWRYPDSIAQRGYMALNFRQVFTLVRGHDAFITDLAARHGVHKAVILTPLIWESMVINDLDIAADTAVRGYYAAMEAGVTPPAQAPSDSSTGVCQIFAATAIAARTYAVEQGLITESLYNPNDWRDVWAVWQKLSSDEEFNIETALFVMMHEAYKEASIQPEQMRLMTPSDVQEMCRGYNGGVVYGRSRTQLYYLIRRWHEDFRA